MKKSAFSLNTIDGSVDDVFEKVCVGYEDLLEGVNKLLLLEGRPGGGRTTLTT